MPSATPQRAAPIASLLPLVGVILIALGSGFALAWVMAQNWGWNQRIAGLSLEVSGALGVLAVAVGACAGLALVRSPEARSAQSLGLRILAAGTTRMLLSLFLGVLLLVAARPEPYTFFAALTTAALACMLGELAWGLTALRKHAGAHSITPGAAAR